MLGGAGVYSDSGASNGQGVGYMNNTNDGEQFSNVAASSSMTLRYASANASNVTLSLYINGTKNQTITLAPTGGWVGSAYYANQLVTATIPSGAAVKFQRDSGDGAVNFDYLTFTP
jgi:hypothetical protein